MRAAPGRHAHRTARRTRRGAPLSARACGLAGLRKAKFPPRPAAAWRGMATRGSWTCAQAARETKAARGRASRRRAERSLTGGAAAPPPTRGPRLPHAPSTPPRGKPREGWRRRDRQRRADSRVHRARARSIPAAMAPVPVAAAAAASRAPRLSAARAAAQPLSPPSRPPARPLARSPARSSRSAARRTPPPETGSAREPASAPGSARRRPAPTGRWTRLP